MNSYQLNYDGYYTMKRHDDEENALKRWFENYKVNRYDYFANEYECLIIKEIECMTRRRGKRFVCIIENEGQGSKREVMMDHTAPVAPILTFAAKRKWTPPPPKSAAELRREAEWDEMVIRGFRPRLVRRPIIRQLTAVDWSKPFDLDMTHQYIEEVVWEPPRYYEKFLDAPKPQPRAAPTHRRNV